jgi:hypothetical protein
MLGDDLGQPLCGLDEHGIADEMAVEVIDRLEQVEIDQKDGAFGCGGLHRREHHLKVFVQDPTVGKPGKGIMSGELLGPFLRRLAAPNLGAKVAGAAKEQDKRDEAARQDGYDDIVELPSLMTMRIVF